MRARKMVVEEKCAGRGLIFYDKIKSLVESIEDEKELYHSIRNEVPDEFKMGRGGSHIWCSTQDNMRIFIIYL